MSTYLFPQLASLVRAITMMKKLTNKMMNMSEEGTVWTNHHLLKETCSGDSEVSVGQVFILAPGNINKLLK